MQKHIAAASANLIQSTDSTQFARDAAELGGAVSRGDEMFARAFEAYIQDELHDAGRKNTYLVSGTRGVHLTPKPARRSRASIAAEHARHDEIVKANPEYAAAKAHADAAEEAWGRAVAAKHTAGGKGAQAKADDAYGAWIAATSAAAKIRRSLVPEIDGYHDGTEHPIYAQPYPQGAERQAINRAMRGFLAALRTSGEVYKALGSTIIIHFPAEALKALAVANRPGLHLDPVRHRWVNDLPPEQKAKVVGEAVRRSLSPDLLKQPYRQQVEQGAHPCTGHCYVASEALYHLMGGKEAGYKPMNIQHEGGPHWWLDGPGGRHDLTAEQFSSPVPYHQGIGKGFMSKNGPDGRQLPSKRAETVMGKALQHLDAGPGAFRQAA